MTQVGNATTGTLYRPGGSWLTRLSSSNVFAWVVSLSVHGVLFLAFYHMVVRDRTQPRVLIIPEARLAAAPGPSGSGSPAPMPDLGRRPEPLAAPSGGGGVLKIPSLSVATGEPGGLVLPGTARGSQGAGGSAGGWGDSVAGSAIGAGGGGGPGGLPTAPSSSFFGQGGNAYRIAYVVDVSGSLLRYTDDIVREMNSSVAALVAAQKFHIILARGQQVEELSARRLVPANAEYKRAAAKFAERIRDVPPGEADVVTAMRRAFAVGPELIYFLSDGDYANIQDQLRSVLHELNREKRTKITVIGFDPSPGPRSLLERIARDHGGHFRVVQPQ